MASPGGKSRLAEEGWGRSERGGRPLGHVSKEASPRRGTAHWSIEPERGQHDDVITLVCNLSDSYSVKTERESQQITYACSLLHGI